MVYTPSTPRPGRAPGQGETVSRSIHGRGESRVARGNLAALAAVDGNLSRILGRAGLEQPTTRGGWDSGHVLLVVVAGSHLRADRESHSAQLGGEWGAVHE